jgi:predicted nucleic-acid-binding protein
VIGLDTNIVVRYLAQDDARQSQIASEIFEHTLSEQNPGFVSVVTMAELAWVLERGYGLDGRIIAVAIERILATDVLVVENEAEVFTAVTALKDGRGSFVDALIGALGRKAGCSRTLTFDRKALRLGDFAVA